MSFFLKKNRNARTSSDLVLEYNRKDMCENTPQEGGLWETQDGLQFNECPNTLSVTAYWASAVVVLSRVPSCVVYFERFFFDTGRFPLDAVYRGSVIGHWRHCTIAPLGHQDDKCTVAILNGGYHRYITKSWETKYPDSVPAVASRCTITV